MNNSNLKKIKNSNFDKLVKKMEQLKETEKGKLKGGVSVLASSSVSSTIESNFICRSNFLC